jgi:hypothetical protein
MGDGNYLEAGTHFPVHDKVRKPSHRIKAGSMEIGRPSCRRISDLFDGPIQF